MDFRPRQPAEGNLSGLWRASPATLELKRTGADADLDDSTWQPLDVPGHWGQAPGLADHDGPVLHRKRFNHRPAEPGERLWLRFDGVLSGAEIWLDGHYIGDTTSYFAQDRFDVTPQLADEREHLLAVEVSCPDQGDSRAKSSLTGSLQTGALAPAGNPGGIWRDVAIDSTGPVAIKHSRLLCTRASAELAEVMVRLVLLAAAQTEIRIDTSIVGPDGAAAGGGVERHSLASGENRIEWSIPIEQPGLWWPAALGEQSLYDVAVAVRLHDGELSDRRDWRTGLREVTVDNFIWRVNGQRLFTKGIAYGPADRFLNDTSSAALAKDMAAIRDSGLDLVRVYGHISRGELYDQADRLGLLVWQDLPMVGGYSSKVRSAARAMARAAVDHIGHHPSVGLWCGHIEPNGQALGEPVDHPGPGAVGDRLRSTRPSSRLHRSIGDDHTSGPAAPEDESTGNGPPPDPLSEPPPDPPSDPHEEVVLPSLARRLGRHFLPSWNRSILDPIVGRELRNADRTRPIVSRSGSLPSPGDPTGSDAHLWLGWHTGRSEDLGRILQRWPRLGAFLGGIGSQSAAVQDWDEAAPQWPGAERGAFNRYLPRGAYGDGRTWARATRAYQADLLRVHIETIRRLKYRPAGGFCVTSLIDADPGGGFGVFDFTRQPKPAHNVLIDACRSVVVMAEPPPPLTVPDQPLSLAVHVVSDLRRPLESIRVTARAHADQSGSGDGSTDPVADEPASAGSTGRSEPRSPDPAGAWSRQMVWHGDLPADCCQWIGNLTFNTPPAPGTVMIDVQLESSELIATNRYRTVVIPASEAIPHPRRPGMR